jgi:hypothetical protein
MTIRRVDHHVGVVFVRTPEATADPTDVVHSHGSADSSL